MFKFISGILFLLAAALLLFAASPYAQYSKPKQERLLNAWSKDFKRLSQDPKFASIFNQLSRVEVHFTDPQVAEEFTHFSTPFRAQSSSGYILKISITRWIEEREYGFVIEHELFNQEEDKVYEFGRTYRIGLIL